MDLLPSSSSMSHLLPEMLMLILAWHVTCMKTRHQTHDAIDRTHSIQTHWILIPTGVTQEMDESRTMISQEELFLLANHRV